MKLHWHIEENFFSKNDIEKINSLVYKNSLKNGKDYPADNIKKCDVKIVFAKHLKKYLEKIYDKVQEINVLNFGFSLFNYFDYDWIYHNTYKSENKGEYDWHIDLNKDTIYDLKFTILVNVSEKKYTGGELLMFLGKIFNIESLNKPGNLIIFPSFLLHKVNPVLTGERKTLVMWQKGKLWN